MEPIKDMWRRFSLSDKEGFDVDLAHTTQQSENILVAKFLTPRVLNIDSVVRTFKPLWKTKKSFSVQDLGKNRTAFVFEDALDLERVLANEPWSFDKFLVIFERLGNDINVDDLLFSHAAFWVQIHNLPIRCMTEEAAAVIGKTLGQVERVADKDDERGGENCMQVRVRLDVTIPLCRGRMIKMEEGKKSWIAFRYEWLPNFCYVCRCLDHAEKDCDDGLKKKTAGSSEGFQYGAWMRADLDRPPRKTVIVVPGNKPREKTKIAKESQARPMAPPCSGPHCPMPEPEPTPAIPFEDQVLDMEFEHNPGFPESIPPQKSKADIFAEKLHAIDEAINYLPNLDGPKSPNPGHGFTIFEHQSCASSVGPGSPQISVTPRVTLGDITNGPPGNNSSPRVRTSKWKKLARAHQPTTGVSVSTCSLKRHPPSEDPDTFQEKKKKLVPVHNATSGSPHTMVVLDGTLEEISAEAGFQLCWKP